jgi:hypothetical protein
MDDDEKKIDEGKELDTDESLEDVNTESSEGEESQEDAQSDSIPIATFLELKKKYKEIRHERDSLRVKSLDEESKTFIESKKQKYLKMGYNEELATELANDLAEVRGLASNKTQKNNIETAISEDIADLSIDPLYKDIKEYEDEIIQKVSDAKRKGYDLEVEDAYLMVSKHKKKTKHKEQQLNDEQIEIIQRKQDRTTTTSNVATSSSANTKSKFNLDAYDKKALSELQKAQPNAKWTAEKYYNMMVKERM